MQTALKVGPIAPPRARRKKQSVPTPPTSPTPGPGLSNSNAAAAVEGKAKPGRPPPPPKFKQNGPPASSSALKKQPLKPAIHIGATAVQPTNSGHEVLAQCYSVGPMGLQNQYDSTSTRRQVVKRSKSHDCSAVEEPTTTTTTTVIDSRDAVANSIYLNVAPKPPQKSSARLAPGKGKNSVDKPERPGKTHTRAHSEAGVSKAPKIPAAVKPTNVRQDLEKRPPPPKKQGGRVPARPAPPCPYLVHASKKAEDGAEYMYVDTSKLRYTPGSTGPPESRLSREIDGLDLSGCGKLDNVNDEAIYTPLMLMSVERDEEYTVPSQLTQSRAAPSPSSTHSEEVTDLSGTGKGSEGRGELLSPDHGVGVLYMNVEKKTAVYRSKSFVFNTSSAPNSPSPSSTGQLSPDYVMDTPHSSDQVSNPYTEITYETKDEASIYEVVSGWK